MYCEIIKVVSKCHCNGKKSNVSVAVKIKPFNCIISKNVNFSRMNKIPSFSTRPMQKEQLFFRKQNLPTLKLSNKTLGVLPPNHPKHLLQVITTEIS